MAQYYYGVFLSNEKIEYSKYYDLDKAIYWIKQAIKYNGDAEASFRLFLYYLFNCDYSYCYDIDQQELYLKRSAIQGNVKAQYNYGIFLSDKESVFFKYYNLNKAIYWIGLATKNGDVDAKNKLQELKNREATHE